MKRRHKSRGAVLIEYTLLLTFFAVPVMGGIAAGGVTMMKDYKQARDYMMRPFP